MPSQHGRVIHRILEELRLQAPHVAYKIVPGMYELLSGKVGVNRIRNVEIDDLLQDVSTAAITSLATAPLDDYEPMQWLQQIARRRVIDAHRFHFDAKRRDAGDGPVQAAKDDRLLGAPVVANEH